MYNKEDMEATWQFILIASVSTFRLA